jgi:hypothetical protein
MGMQGAKIVDLASIVELVGERVIGVQGLRPETERLLDNSVRDVIAV